MNYGSFCLDGFGCPVKGRAP